MASAVDHAPGSAHCEFRGIRIRFHLHRDQAGRELRRALKLAEKQQNFVRKHLPLEETVTDTRGSPSFIWRNDALIPKTPKRRPKVRPVRVRLPDAPTVQQNTFDFEDEKRKPLLDGPPPVDTRKREEDDIEYASIPETDITSSFGK